MPDTSILTLTLPEQEKNAAFALFEELGVHPDTVIQCFFQYVIEHKALPFPVSEEAMKALEPKATEKTKKGDIFQYAGAGKHQKQRCFATAQEADAFISQLRDGWEER